MQEEKIRVGIIGANPDTGWGQSAHLPALLALPEFELVAVCTAHAETAAASAAKFGARLAFHDHREMVEHQDVDVVVVNVKVPLHYRLTTDALNAGKHVYCEWPLGANLAEAQELADLARRKGVRTIVGLQGRASPSVLWLKELIDQGYVGEVLACHLTQFTRDLKRTPGRSWMADKSMGANPLTIYVGHTVDSFCLAVGEFREVSAVVSTQSPEWREIGTDRPVPVTSPDNILMSGRLTGGAVASVHIASVPYQPSGLSLQVFGTDGTLVLTSQEIMNIGACRLQGTRKDSSAPEELPVPQHLTWVPEKVPQGAPLNVAQMYRRFSEAISSGQQAVPDFDTAVMRHKFLDAIELASDTGTRQMLEA